MTGDPTQIAALVVRLKDLGVELPEAIARGGDQLARMFAFGPRLAPPADPLSLTDEEMRQAVHDLAIGSALSGSGGHGERAVDTMRLSLGAALALALRDCADSVIDQLRPGFETAAAEVRTAVELGITPQTTDTHVVKADNIEAVRDAWTALPRAARVLDAIAAARLDLSDATGVAPSSPMRGYTLGRPQTPLGETWPTAAFRRTPAEWRRDFEHTWQLWLRLSGPGPVELLTVAESASVAAAAAALESRGPIAPSTTGIGARS